MNKRRLRQIWVYDEDARVLKSEAAERGMTLSDLIGEKAKNEKKKRFDFGF